MLFNSRGEETIRVNGTYNDLEDEKPSHQGKLQPRPFWNALKPREEAKHDRKEHHKNGKQDGRQNTGNDADYNIWQLAYPGKPGRCST
jgi:hypothetical protein